MHACGMATQFAWRFWSLTARVLCMATFAVTFPLWITVLFHRIFMLATRTIIQMAVACFHYAISTAHLLLWQRLSLRGCGFELVVVLIAAWVHLFTPFNVAEGRTRWR